MTPTAVVVVVWTSVAALSFQITGTVVDGHGVPVAGATVWLLKDRKVSRMQSDGSGAFSLDLVAAGEVELVARKEGYALDGFSGVVSAPIAVTLRLGEPDTIDLRIVDAAFRPVEGACLLRMLVDDRFHVPLEYLTPEGFPAVRSNGFGHMTIPDLPKGAFIAFFVGDRKHAETYIPYLPVGGHQQDIRLFPGVLLCGRVTDEEEKGVPDALVTAHRMGAGERREFKEVFTDTEGFYRVVVAPGEYRVVARHDRYAASDIETAVLENREGENVVNLLLPAPRKAEGHVLDPDGKPAPGVLVTHWALGRMPEETVTGQDGRYAFRVPACAGAARVVPPPGFYTEPFGDLPVDLRDKEALTLPPVRLKRIPTVEGAVVDSDGIPAPRVLVTSLDLAPPALAITNATGRFHLLLPYAPKEPNVRFRAEDADRFLRAEFVAAIQKSGALSVQLQPFDPDLSACQPLRAGNDLSDLVGLPAPELACDAWFGVPPTADGKEQQGPVLADLRGKVVVLTLWGGLNAQGATRRCMAELCALHALLQGSDDTVFVGVHDAAARPFEVEKYLQEFGIRFPVGHDAEPYLTFERYKIERTPQTVLIDKKGVVRYYDVKGRLLELIKDLRRKP